MLIAIISDIHDNLANLEKCLSWCQQSKINSLICCGDITNLETVSYLAQNFSGEIFVVAGNAEIYKEAELAKFKNINYYGEIAINEFNGVNIGFCHEPEKIKKIQELSPLELDFIFYGHTHKPWLEKKGSTLIVNPGTLGGIFTSATFAILDVEAKNLSLKILADL
jgi:putative phosphoesterase